MCLCAQIRFQLHGRRPKNCGLRSSHARVVVVRSLTRQYWWEFVELLTLNEYAGTAIQNLDFPGGKLKFELGAY